MEAVRSERWKLHFPHQYRHLKAAGNGGMPGPYENRSIGLSLFNLELDPGETTDLAASHPEVVARLEGLAEAARAELGDTATGRRGAGVRPSGRVNP